MIFVVLTFLAGSVQPDYTKIDPNSGFLDILGIVGGKPLQLYASIVVVLSFSLASGEECITSVSRILYAVGRDGILPRRFGKLNDKTHTPVFATLIVAAISLVLALSTSTDILGNTVSHGALVGFVLLNLTVIWKLFVKSDDRSFRSVLSHVVAPLIGTGVSVWIFTGLGPLAWSVGTVWLVVGLIITAIRTGFFRKKLGASENLQEYFA